ncbi:Cd(II)/Pb(II)-responsive transcriptional regulator [Tepidicella xavieri]|uniref:DNA-binding transcriptional MerR regulator n=1 Tax=Tepidicella xavieri TaxID=360241 RepID=A0A4V3D6L9_9BURK|nr:Cd(II)/Pb(II)-responsive transcriptional regulator [Tepidicella xavieri]TDQ44477.1 DNA-binding transcriptional MerR regulator [Tepidicella xavieri]
MQIKELAQRAGVAPETIRFYEKEGLLPAPARRANGYRAYDDAHLDRLVFIRRCRSLDMPLPVIARLIAFMNDPADTCHHVDDILAEQLAQVRARIRSMRALERQLLDLQRQCDGPIDGGACGVLRELSQTGRRAAAQA